MPSAAENTENDHLWALHKFRESTALLTETAAAAKELRESGILAVANPRKHQITTWAFHITRGKFKSKHKYLGCDFSFKGLENAFIIACFLETLVRLKKAYLKPWQKMEILKIYVLPRIYHALSIDIPSFNVIRTIDDPIKQMVKETLHLHHSTTDGLLYCRNRNGSEALPTAHLSMISGIKSLDDPEMKNLILNEDLDRKAGLLRRKTGVDKDFDPKTKQETKDQNPNQKPSRIPRHVLGQCPFTKRDYIHRHDEIRDKIAQCAGRNGYTVHKERQCTLPDGTRLRPDMILIHEANPSVILNVAVIFETGESLNLAAQEKSSKYLPLVPVIKTEFGTRSAVVVLAIFGQRGAVPKYTVEQL